MKSADVSPGVISGDILYDQDPVVVSLFDDGVSDVPAEGQVAHSQQVQGASLLQHRPGHHPFLTKVQKFLTCWQQVSLVNI